MMRPTQTAVPVMTTAAAMARAASEAFSAPPLVSQRGCGVAAGVRAEEVDQVGVRAAGL